MEVHRILGSGFLEAVYQAALEKELTLRGIPFEHQVELPVIYKGDLVIDKKFVVEIKSVSRLNASHQAQAMHYLAATGLRLALLNFGPHLSTNTALSNKTAKRLSFLSGDPKPCHGIY